MQTVSSKMLRQQGNPESVPFSENREKNEEGLQYVTLHLNMNKLDGDVKMRLNSINKSLYITRVNSDPIFLFPLQRERTFFAST